MLTIVDQNHGSEKHPLTEVFSGLLYDLTGLSGGTHQVSTVLGRRRPGFVFGMDAREQGQRDSSLGAGRS
jgi:hypothetical protein